MAFDFRTEFYRCWGLLVDGYGVDSVFTPLSGDPVDLRVIFSQASQVFSSSGGLQSWELADTVEYSLEDIPREVIVGESFLIEGVEKSVRLVESNNGYVVKVIVS